MVVGLRCSACNTEYQPETNEPWRCRTCGIALDFGQTDSGGSTPEIGNIDTDNGLWSFSEFIPIDKKITLGEGWTPEVPDDNYGANFKLEYLNPSASFKDRGTTTMLSRALELNAKKIIDDSSGNAGSSIALYAARVGLDAEIYVPASAPNAKISAIEQTGATPVVVEGSRQSVRETCIERAKDEDVWYASHCWRPSFLAGTQTFALEVAYRRNWSVPDVVILPAGAGTLLLGTYHGFKMLYERGMTAEMPRLMAAQAAGFAPLATEFQGSLDDCNKVAKGVHIDEPPRQEEMLEAIKATGGTAIAITEDETQNTHTDLHQSGFYIEMTSAVAPAALKKFRSMDLVGPEDDIVVALSGSGLKDSK